MAELRDAVYVDGVRVPIGRARPDGLYARTRADDMAVRTIRALLDRNPGLDPARVDDNAWAATTQTGDQGLTMGRTTAMLAGLPKSVPGYAVDRMCAGALRPPGALALDLPTRLKPDPAEASAGL